MKLPLYQTNALRSYQKTAFKAMIDKCYPQWISLYTKRLYTRGDNVKKMSINGVEKRIVEKIIHRVRV
ncbi:hypothetical protein SIN01_18760 [Sporolactobacillus inulinus]|nr:hypothetical protein SIN01_18760 [Sporolactobacillus inulinus]